MASRLTHFSIGLILSCIVLGRVTGQNVPAAGEEPIQLPSTSVESGEENLEPLSDQEVKAIRSAIENLSASQFRVRENAAAELMTFGKRSILEMQDAIENANDPETRLRIEQIVQQLAEGDMQTRIKAFLSGQNVPFKGWPVIQRFLGDSITVRELFVEIMQKHPNVGESMEGTTRERAMALEKTLTAVQPKLNSIRNEPDRADLFALLLVALDPDVPLPVTHEQVILRLCQRRLVTEVRRDVSLSGPFSALMNRWILRASETNREEVLLTGMEMDLSSTLTLAELTLSDSESVDTIATAFQAISKFGGRQQVAIVEKFLDDGRVVGAPAITNDPALPQLGDLSLITLAILTKQSLDEFGLGNVELHPLRGFLLPSEVFVNESSIRRNDAREKIRQSSLMPANEPALVP
ncbi:MAG: hypothetical protein VXZ38_05115 [Planctomycetota bacterium]|nr:hypothetical protein [Planctomycetota bacterium]